MWSPPRRFLLSCFPNEEKTNCSWKQDENKTHLLNVLTFRLFQLTFPEFSKIITYGNILLINSRSKLIFCETNKKKKKLKILGRTINGGAANYGSIARQTVNVLGFLNTAPNYNNNKQVGKLTRKQSIHLWMRIVDINRNRKSYYISFELDENKFRATFAVNWFGKQSNGIMKFIAQ